MSPPSCRWLIALTPVLAAFALARPDPAPGQGKNPKAPPLSKEQPEKLSDLNRLITQINQLESAGKLDEAAKQLEKLIGIEKEIFGASHDAVAQTQAWLARIHLGRKDIPAARAAHTTVVTILTALRGPNDWRVADARFALSDLERLARMTDADQADLAEAKRLTSEAGRLSIKGKDDEAEKLYLQAKATHQRVLGAQHPDYAQSLDRLAIFYTSRKNFAAAALLHQLATEVMRGALGERHPRYAECLHHGADHFRLSKDYAQAEPLFNQALKIRKEALGESHLDTAHTLNTLGVMLHARKDYARAEPHYRQALEIHRKAHGDQHPNTLVVAKNLQGLYKKVFEEEDQQPAAIKDRKLKERDQLEADTRKLERQGKIADAIVVAGKMLALEREVFGAEHDDVAGSLAWLSRLHLAQEDFASARQFALEQLGQRNQLHGANHWRTTDARLQLDLVNQQEKLTAAQRQALRRALDWFKRVKALDKEGKFSDALSLGQEALAIHEEALGPDHLQCAVLLSWIAVAQNQTKAGAVKVDATGQRELTIRRKVQGNHHPQVAHLLYDLGVRAENRNALDKAADYFLEAKTIYESSLGKSHQKFINAVHSLDNLASDFVRKAGYAVRDGQWIEAKKAWDQVIALRTGAFGADDWETTDARVALAEVQRMGLMTAAQLEKLAAAKEQRQFDDLNRVKIPGRTHQNLPGRTQSDIGWTIW